MFTQEDDVMDEGFKRMFNAIGANKKYSNPRGGCVVHGCRFGCLCVLLKTVIILAIDTISILEYKSYYEMLKCTITIRM